MKSKVLYIITIVLFVSCQKEEADYVSVSNQNAKISFTTLLCPAEQNPVCGYPLPPAMGATIRLYKSFDERDQRINEIVTVYTDHHGEKTISIEAGFYYIYTLHSGREDYSQENAPVNSHSFHEIILPE